MSIFDFLQLAGGMILAVGYIPQIIQIHRTKSCKDLNLKTYLSMVLGIGLMEVYAIDLFVGGTGLMFLITNSILLALVITISTQIICVRRKNKGEG